MQCGAGHSAVLSFPFTRHTSAVQRFSATVSPARRELLGWIQDSFTSCSDGEATPGVRCRGFLKGDTPFSPLQYSSRLVFNKMRDLRSVRGDRGALSSAAAAWLKGNPGSPFHPVLLSKKQQFACKRRFASVRWEFPLLFSNMHVTLKKSKEIVRYQCSWLRLIHTDGVWLWGDHNRHFCVTGSLCCLFKKMYMTAEDKILSTIESYRWY